MCAKRKSVHLTKSNFKSICQNDVIEGATLTEVPSLNFGILLFLTFSGH